MGQGRPLVSHAFPDRTDRFVSLPGICGNGQIADRLRHLGPTSGTPGCIRIDGARHRADPPRSGPATGPRYFPPSIASYPGDGRPAAVPRLIIRE